ncbi:MAG TPA: YkvA family protein [Burkholderiaceae bacterium]|nr:YkvA family protein [Burkholderiaceae bacterium]
MAWFWRLRLLFKRFGRDALVLLFALRHPSTPRSVKLGVALMALYLVSPIDLIPDFLVLLGITDDVALLAIGVPVLLRRLPLDAYAAASARVDALLRRWGMSRAAG